MSVTPVASTSAGKRGAAVKAEPWVAVLDGSDARRPDAVVPFQAPAADAPSAPDVGIMLAMGAAGVAIFTRRRLLGWVALYLGLNRCAADRATFLIRQPRERPSALS